MLTRRAILAASVTSAVAAAGAGGLRARAQTLKKTVHMVVGFPAGIGSLKTNLPLLKSASLVGVHLRHFNMERPAEAAANSAAVLQLASQGVLKPVIARRYPIGHYVEAMHEGFSGKTAGRVVLVMG